jgi:hypothetical protein
VIDKSVIIDGFGDALESGMRFDKPFCLYNFRPFTPALYDQILANLPDDGSYMELVHPDAMLPDKKSARLVFPLREKLIREKLTGEQRDFWLEMTNVLCDDKLRDLFKRAFEPQLKKRFGAIPLSEIPALPVPMLMRDFAFYKIRIHPDIDTKVITTQYYLPCDRSQSHLGTSIYRRTLLKKFELVRKLEFLPGSSYAFAVSRDSWHAVDPMNEIESPRNSLMLIYFRLPGIDY